MELTGRQIIKAERATVWAALNDAEVLRLCIEGCESLVPVENNQYEGIVVAAIGPVKARFAVNVALSNLEDLKGYTISGEGKGGAAGFARGEATIRLSDDPEGTCVEYAAKANVGGKIAQLGARLVDATAAKQAQTFFTRLKAKLETGISASDLSLASPAKRPEVTPIQPYWFWIAAGVAALALVVLLF